MAQWVKAEKQSRRKISRCLGAPCSIWYMSECSEWCCFSRCQVGAFEQYRNVTVASVHNPYNLWDRTQYLELHLCAEQPIAQAYYVVVHCQQQPTAAPQSVSVVSHHPQTPPHSLVHTLQHY